MADLKEDDIRKIRSAATIEVSKMFALVNRRVPEKIFSDGVIDVQKIRTNRDSIAKIGGRFEAAFFAIFFLLSLNYFSGEVKVNFGSFRLENLGGLVDMLLFASAFAMAMSFSYNFRKNYYEALIKNNIIYNESIENWLIRLDEEGFEHSPIILDKEKSFFSNSGKIKSSFVRFIDIITLFVIIPLLVGYVMIAGGTIFEVWMGEANFFLKLIATVPFIAINILILLDVKSGSMSDQEFFSRKIETVLTESLTNMGRPDFERKCEQFEAMKLRLSL